ncbi:MAG TPA: sigma-70 family RNA polymerase sigma factor [Gaiellales bacterium]|jgi:RNA polymerase sigma-70 factor (ECF subfamily)|nr:sigma-70 family RNA polymerase sigma factor [Gaiellales bacterium]
MTLADLPDAELVRRMRNGDEAAWAAFVERYSRYVYAIAIRAYRLREHDAEDVFQEVFARAYSHLGSLRNDDGVRPWIGQLTRHLCVDRLRSSGREELAANIEVAAEETIERIEEACVVQEALGTLSLDCREVVDRFFCRDESYRQIGDALGIPSGTIASRISRCLARLREHMEAR